MKVYCEPFCIKDGYQFEIHHVSYKQDDLYSCFMHFHEVHELIIFEEIQGDYYYNQGKSALVDNDIVFTPALETHNFELNNTNKSWFIIQFLPEFLIDNDLTEEASFFHQGLHLRLSKSELEAVSHQVKWLKQSYDENPHSNKSIVLLKLLIIWLAEHATPVKAPHTKSINTSTGYEKLAPIVDKFRYQNNVNLSLEEAANLCHLSPSYFSRLFKSVFRCNFSEYTIKHKLYSAARLLSQSHYSITDISYELNFSSPSHFIALFKKQFGTTPKKYQLELKLKTK